MEKSIQAASRFPQGFDSCHKISELHQPCQSFPVGGLMGYLKSGSSISLISGGLSASVLYYVHTQLPTDPVFASSVGLGISAVLLIVMGARFKNSGKIFPAGVVSLVSLIMTGGYLHGILRSSHA